jgi:hypothetical protein
MRTGTRTPQHLLQDISDNIKLHIRAYALSARLPSAWSLLPATIQFRHPNQLSTIGPVSQHGHHRGETNHVALSAFVSAVDLVV